MKINRSITPQPVGEISFTLPEIKHLKSENGLNILFVQKDNLPIIQTNLIVNAGGYFDPKGKSGLSKLTGMMIDEGAGGLNALELDDAIDSLGSVLEISNDHDSIFISLLSMKETFSESLNLFSKIICEPHFEKEDFEREQKKAIIKTIQYKDDPSFIASAKFEEIIFSGTGYENPIQGTEATLNSINAEDVKEFHSLHFNLNNSVMVVVGNISETELLENINKYFRSFKSGKNFNPEESETKTSNKVYICHKENTTQSEIRVGLPTSLRDNPDYFSKLLLNSVLGGQFSSRINLNLREDKGYTYGAHSSFSYTKKAAHFAVTTSVQIENTIKALLEIFKELKSIKDGISEEELNFAKSYLIKKFPSMFETYSQIARNVNTKTVYNLDDKYFDNYINNLQHLTIDDLLSAAVQEIKDSDLTTVIVCDKNKIQDQLELLNGCEIEYINF